MLDDTKFYSDFIKRNKIKVDHWGFTVKGKEIHVYQTERYDVPGPRYWYAGDDGDPCYTKKQAIWMYIDFYHEIVNGYIK